MASCMQQLPALPPVGGVRTTVLSFPSIPDLLCATDAAVLKFGPRAGHSDPAKIFHMRTIQDVIGA
jgi:hypothetical protein